MPCSVASWKPPLSSAPLRRGIDDIDKACAYAAMAKNRRPDRTGFSARARVFGADEMLPASVTDSLTDQAVLPALDLAEKDDSYRRGFLIREASMVALQKLGHPDRWRRAIVAGQRPNVGPYFPGSQVFFWRAARAAQNLRRRGARMFSRWHEPAVVIGREARSPHHDEGYWVSHQGSLLLVAPEHVRAETLEEQLANTRISDILDKVAEGMAAEDHDEAGRPVEFGDPRGQEVPLASGKPGAGGESGRF